MLDALYADSTSFLHRFILIWNMWEIPTKDFPRAMSNLTLLNDVFNSEQLNVFGYILEG